MDGVQPWKAHQMAGIFGTVYVRTSTQSKAINVFKSCGLWPFDSNIRRDEDFAAAELTEEARPVVRDIDQVDADVQPVPKCFFLSMFRQQSQYDSRLRFSSRVLVRVSVMVRLGLGLGLELVIGLWLGLWLWLWLRVRVRVKVMVRVRVGFMVRVRVGVRVRIRLT